MSRCLALLLAALLPFPRKRALRIPCGPRRWRGTRPKPSEGFTPSCTTRADCPRSRCACLGMTLGGDLWFCCAPMAERFGASPCGTQIPARLRRFLPARFRRPAADRTGPGCRNRSFFYFSCSALPDFDKGLVPAALFRYNRLLASIPAKHTRSQKRRYQNLDYSNRSRAAIRRQQAFFKRQPQIYPRQLLWGHRRERRRQVNLPAAAFGRP